MSVKLNFKEMPAIPKLALDFLMVILAGVVVGLFSMTFVTTYCNGEIGGVTCGYNLISFDDGYDQGIAVLTIFILISLCIFVFSSLVKMMIDVDILPKNIFAKIVNIVVMISGVALAVLLLSMMIALPQSCKSTFYAIANSSGSGDVSSTWVLILNFVIGISIVLCAFLTSLDWLNKNKLQKKTVKVEEEQQENIQQNPVPPKTQMGSGKMVVFLSDLVHRSVVTRKTTSVNATEKPKTTTAKSISTASKLNSTTKAKTSSTTTVKRSTSSGTTKSSTTQKKTTVPPKRPKINNKN